MSWRPERFLALSIILIASPVNLWLRAAELGSTSPTGTVRLGSGLVANYAYYYNRNALADATRAADAIIARTDSGNLLRFDRTTLKLTREWFGPVPVTCLGRGEGEVVLAGFADGRVCRIDEATLAMTEIARLPGKLQWVGTIAAAPGQPARQRLIAVYEQIKKSEIRGRTYGVPYSVVRDAASGKSYPIDPKSDYPSDLRATAFLLDRKHRVWLGAENGEWGGWCECVDLDAGQVRTIAGQRIYQHTPELKWDGVYGFSELRDGQVWAYGGTMHFSSDAFIWRIDRGRSEQLYRAENDTPGAEERPKVEIAAAQPAQEKKDGQIEGNRGDLEIPPEQDEPPSGLRFRPRVRPDLPITQVIEDTQSGRITVIAVSDIYWTDTRLRLWGKEHELQIGYRSGRRDAMGSYPSVRAVVPIELPGTPLELMFATRFDGLIHLVGGKETGHAQPGQMVAESIERIENSSDGVLVFEEATDTDSLQLVNGAWKTVSFAPPDPAAAAPLAPLGAEPDKWSESQVLVGRDGSITTISASSQDPGTRATTIWRNGKAQVVGRETSSLNPQSCFLTPDGTLWNANHRSLMRFSDGRWTTVGAFEWPPGLGRFPKSDIGSGLRTANDSGPPWFLHDRDNELLLRLAYGPQFKDPRLEPLPLKEVGQNERLKVRDAIAWKSGELLLATDRGLRTLVIDGGKIAVPLLDTSGRPVSHLARDRAGRLWLGGDGLAVLDADGKTLHALDELPMFGRSKIETLAADPGKASGAIVAIEGRGVVFVRVGG